MTRSSRQIHTARRAGLDYKNFFEKMKKHRSSKRDFKD